MPTILNTAVSKYPLWKKILFLTSKRLDFRHVNRVIQKCNYVSGKEKSESGKGLIYESTDQRHL